MNPQYPWAHLCQVSGRGRSLSPHSCVVKVNIQSSGFHCCVHQLNICFICPEPLIWGNEIIMIIWHQRNKQVLAGNYRDLDTPPCPHAGGGYDYTWLHLNHRIYRSQRWVMGSVWDAYANQAGYLKSNYSPPAFIWSQRKTFCRLCRVINPRKTLRV